ncbi:hypothetical protein [Kitasatospora brasiliensis]|uniref:hypothetical protein n=1 Tax=Kitasatospora brasiliensis TaxID=3058040 RepID=UPI00292EA859|nr:hypothetical protein [Kitasatospora sp. K002]
MQPRTSFAHTHHDVAEPPAGDGPSGTVGSTLLAHLPRSSPEVMESIAVALLSLTAPGVCLRAGRAIPSEPSGGAVCGAVEAGRDLTNSYE